MCLACSHDRRVIGMPDIRLLVAEDSTLVRGLLAQHLEREEDFCVVGVARNGREAVDLAAKLHPDVVVMDLDMPLLNGVQATERITAQYPYIKVILLTAHDDLASIGRFSGAFASLNKGSTTQDLVTEIRRAHAAKGRTTPESVVTDYSTPLELLSIRSGLTGLEKSVLVAVVEAEHTIEQIAAGLAKELNKKVTVSSVKHALGRVMNKLHVEPRTRAALVKHVLEFVQNQ